MSANPTICVVGLGYVGLPLAHAFAKQEHTVAGYDVNEQRIQELAEGHDATNELTDDQLKEVEIKYSSTPEVIGEADVVIVAVPTPIDEQKKPDITILKAATKMVGKHLKKGSVIVFESTVYPGTTEEICGPILQSESGLQCGVDFKLGYSPERINPGDKEHTISRITKVVAGQDRETLKVLSDLYGSIIEAGIHEASNIQVAEMAKAIENAQRDLNIAFVNEVAMLCTKLGIKTKDVLAAAGTKWNFLQFQPGLVGGHCIGVDPYYLVEKAKQVGMETEVITAGRSVNDGMGAFVAQQIIDALPCDPSDATVLVLGITFKENVPDTRNSRVVDVVRSLEAVDCDVLVHDPHYDDAALSSRGFNPGSLENGPFDAVALLVPHRQYLVSGAQMLIDASKVNSVIYDLKSQLDETVVLAAERKYRTL